MRTYLQNVYVRVFVANLAGDPGNLLLIALDSQCPCIELAEESILHQNFQQVDLPADHGGENLANRCHRLHIDTFRKPIIF